MWSRLRRFVLGCIALVAVGLTVAPGPVRHVADPVSAAVEDKLVGRAAHVEAQGTRVTVTRRDGTGWAFGTGVIVAAARRDAYPRGWLFLAHREGERWQVAFDDEAGFSQLAWPAPMMSRGEREAFSVAEQGGDKRTGMRLPYALGQTWRLTGGPHPMSGSALSSVDLAGGDLRVLAARGGTGYTMCRGWIRVVHDRGYATDYYHLWHQIKLDGTPVAQGQFLGDAGTDVTCGGSATGRHLHFSLRQYGKYLPIAGYGFGKWVMYQGDRPYDGYALHGSRRADVGEGLTNYGALGFDQGIVDTDGGGTLHRRAGPGTGNEVLGSLEDGDTVTLACSAHGTEHEGRYGTSDVWNKLSDGSWISDAYVWTGADQPVSGWC